MSNRARWITLVVVAALIALGAGVVATYASLENRIETRWEALRASTSDLAPDQTPEARELTARLDGIDRWVRENVDLHDPFPFPWERSAEEIVDLPARLDRMGEFFEQVDALTGSEACRKTLERGVTLDMPTRELVFVRTRANLLCERAWVDQRIVGDGRAAARRLGQALDLARLGDDGSLVGFLMEIANEGSVLLATQSILQDPRCDAFALHEQLDARLARLGDPDRLRRALALEFVAFRERVHGKGISGRLHELRYLEALDRGLALLDVPGIEVAPRIRSFEPDGYPFDSVLCGVVQNWHIARTQTELGRAALALTARSVTSLPVDPFSNEPFARETTPDGERISSPAAIRSLGNPDKPYLLSWTVPR